MDSEEKEQKEKNIIKLTKLGFGFKLVRFTSVLSVTWIITALAGCSLGVSLAFAVADREYLPWYIFSLVADNFTIGGALVLGGIFLFSTFSFLTWGRMFAECRAENISGIGEIAKAYSYVSAILNLILNLAGLFLLTVYEEHYLESGIEFIFHTNPGGPILALLIFLTGMFYTSKLLHGLRMHQDEHLKGYILFRYFMLGIIVILTIVTVTVISINGAEQLQWTLLCGFLVLALECLIFMLDVGPTIILHSIWNQESPENPIYTIHN